MQATATWPSSTARARPPPPPQQSTRFRRSCRASGCAAADPGRACATRSPGSRTLPASSQLQPRRLMVSNQLGIEPQSKGVKWTVGGLAGGRGCCAGAGTRRELLFRRKGGVSCRRSGLALEIKSPCGHWGLGRTHSTGMAILATGVGGGRALARRRAFHYFLIEVLQFSSAILPFYSSESLVQLYRALGMLPGLGRYPAALPVGPDPCQCPHAARWAQQSLLCPIALARGAHQTGSPALLWCEGIQCCAVSAGPYC